MDSQELTVAGSYDKNKGKNQRAVKVKINLYGFVGIYFLGSPEAFTVKSLTKVQLWEETTWYALSNHVVKTEII